MSTKLTLALDVIGTVAIATLAVLALGRETRYQRHRRPAQPARPARTIARKRSGDLGCSQLFGDIGAQIRSGADPAEAEDLLILYQERCVRTS